MHRVETIENDFNGGCVAGRGEEKLSPIAKAAYAGMKSDASNSPITYNSRCLLAVVLCIVILQILYCL